MTDAPHAMFRTGMVTLLGRTNVGKSTLLNALVDAKVSIVTPRPQTTRHAIHGIVHRPEGQLVLVDTPGFFKTHQSRLVDKLHVRARAALADIDAVVHVVDPTRAPGEEEEMVGRVLETVGRPRVLCVNKIDAPRRPHLDEWRQRAGAYAAAVEVSALARRNLEVLVTLLRNLMPAGPPLYPPEEITNAHRDFRMGEIVREKIYLLTREEVPYRTAVRVDEVETAPGGARGPMEVVRATILVADERYKGMLIGKGGQMIRDIGTAARTDLQRLLRSRVVLELRVRVDSRLPE